MSDRPIDAMDPFETRLGQDLRSLSARALRSVVAIELAHEVAGAAPRSRLRGLPRFRLDGRFGWSPSARRAAVLAAAAVVVVVGGVGFAVLRQPQGVATEPSPKASASPAPSTSPSTDRAVVRMAELQAHWKSAGTRTAPFVNGSHTIVAESAQNIVVGPTGISINAFKADVLSDAAVVRPGIVQVWIASATPDWSCTIGDAGTYSVGLSPSGQDMTVTLVSDACAERAANLVGVWSRTDIGPLAAGDHASRLFRPFGTSGQLSYTVPTGWEEANECTNCFSLFKPGDLAGLDISVMADVVPATPGPRCGDMVAGAGTTPAGIAAWLASIQNLTVTKATPITVGGLGGVIVDLTLSPGAPQVPCPYLDGLSGSVWLADPASPDSMLSVQSTGRVRYVLLDRGDGHTLLIVIEVQDKTMWDASLTEAMTIVRSIEFAR